MTDIGSVRSSNQDNFLIDPSLGLVAVADGMGGHDMGEVASADALCALALFIRTSTGPDPKAALSNFQPSAFDPAQLDPDATWTDATMGAMVTLHDALEFANQRLYQSNLARRCGDGGGMGTTLTGLWQAAPHGPVFVFHVGDSRLYRFRQGRLGQLTRDQTLYQQAIEAGEHERLPSRNLLLQAVGPSSEIAPELHIETVAPGDLYLLCSDGLHGACTDERIASVLATTSADNLELRCAQLIEIAKHEGSRDNITVVLIACK
jgi:protein phosphatase